MCCKLAGEFPSGVPPPPHTSYDLTIAYRFFIHVREVIMVIIYVVILMIMLLFKNQARSLLEALVKLIIALSDAICKSIK